MSDRMVGVINNNNEVGLMTFNTKKHMSYNINANHSHIIRLVDLMKHCRQEMLEQVRALIEDKENIGEYDTDMILRKAFEFLPKVESIIVVTKDGHHFYNDWPVEYTYTPLLLLSEEVCFTRTPTAEYNKLKELGVTVIERYYVSE